MSRRARIGQLAAMTVIVFTALLVSWLAMEVSFPAFEFVSDRLPRRLIPAAPFDEIAGRVSRFLWDHRALDLTGQAFVIVAAIVCCMALLKPEEVEG